MIHSLVIPFITRPIKIGVTAKVTRSIFPENVFGNADKKGNLFSTTFPQSGKLQYAAAAKTIIQFGLTGTGRLYAHQLAVRNFCVSLPHSVST